VGIMPSFYEITRFSVAVSDAITAVSRFLRDETIKEFKIEKPIDVIHNFIDCNEFRPSRNQALKKRLAPGGEKVIMHASNFRKVKKLPVVIEVFDKVRRAVPCRLVLIGDGPEREPTERLVNELGVTDFVTFMGEQEFIADILPVADVFLLPSAHESFGLSALEAMSCAVPVVASNIGGLHEVVEEGVTGYLCSPDDPGCMAGIITMLFRDEGKRRQMGLQGRERAKRDFGKDAIIDQYIALYERVLGTRA
jgi:N-acetyl-alpha-D-glucosaminyl L-malate synthase BshA